MHGKLATSDRAVAHLAARQHGVVTAKQLLECGLDDGAVARRVAHGGLHRVHRGVYAVGHSALPQEGRWMAAVLSCGERAVLAYASAAALWGMLWPRKGPVEVSVAGNAGRAQRADIHLRRCPTLTAGQVTRCRGIPVTNPARTIIDIRRVLPAAEVRRAIRQAESLGLAVGLAPGSDGTRSELEHRFLALCKRAGLPQPEINVAIGRFIIDFVWREQRLIVETDGYRYHRGRIAFEDDRARDLELRRAGFDVLRLTYTQITVEPKKVVGALETALLGREVASSPPPARGTRHTGA
jgi:hypothetical protein